MPRNEPIVRAKSGAEKVQHERTCPSPIAFGIELFADGDRSEILNLGPLQEAHRPLVDLALKAFYAKSATCKKINRVNVILNNRPATIRELRAFADGVRDGI